MPAAPRTPVAVDAEVLDLPPRAGAPSKLAHIVMKTPRLDEMVDWYTTVLDAIVVFRDKRIAFLTYDTEHHRVALIRLPRILRIPGMVWKAHRKFWGVDHVAFTYNSLDSLIATYRRLTDAGIEPVWCINHGPTTSMYYEDPDGNRLELQADNFATNHELLAWINGGEFDPDVLEHKLAEGVPISELVRRGSAPTPRRKPRTGLHTLRWKTL